MGRVLRRFWWVPAGAAVLAVLAVAASTLWPAAKPTRLPVRARVYAATQVCLLTPPAGLADPRAAAAWAGMRDASSRTRAQVRYLSVVGQDSAGNTEPYLASLAVGGCEAVLVTDGSGAAAVTAEGARFAKVRFLVLGGTGHGVNVSSISYLEPAQARAAVAAAVERL
ncbi:hypothetical protein [Streptacidiphilus sp. EB129]|uniref:hypothetical protein n=1 Tax=Streptacidiphilus sp. EB129 TaxID=3156262 RepID=UPI003512262E